MERYVIIGGGVAALEAAKAIRKRDETSPVVMVCGEAHHPYNRPGLSAAIASGAAFETLLLEPAAYYPEHGIEVRCGVRAEAVDATAHKVRLSDGEQIGYTKLLLATGANPFNPIKYGEATIPVRTLRCYEDAGALAADARGRRVVLVGGGILGLEAAVSLHAIGAAVTVVEFAPRILPLQTDEAASAMLTRRLEALGIKLVCERSVQEATPTGVVLNDGSRLEADLVLASMGVRSETALAAAMGLALDRGVVVDECMRTSLAGVWAAGDCAQYEGRVLATAGAARAMGAVAGADMAGQAGARYTPFIPATIFGFEGFSLFSAGGVSAGHDADVAYTASDAYRRLFFVQGGLSGALFVGKNPAGKAMQALAAKALLAQALELLL